jgi:adenine-specific DNA-methyltransferase
MSTNKSREKREELLVKLEQIRTYIESSAQPEIGAELLHAIEDIEQDINGRKFGLVYEEHREKIEDILETHRPVLVEDESAAVICGGETNLLIEGDNLAALKLLEEEYTQKVDVIYIDPPYNTKNKDFIYDDTFVDAGDSFRHSKWVSFMRKRLKVASRLLADGGVIFISIDDNEQATLRFICDQLFGEENFVSQLVWEKKRKGSFLSNSITNIKEYILVYTNNIKRFPGLVGQVTRKRETYPCINAVNKRGIRRIPAGVPSNYKDKDYFLPTGAIISDKTMNMVLHSDLIISGGVLEKDVLIEGNWRYAQDALDEFAEKGELYLTRDLYLRRIVDHPRFKMLKDLLSRVGDDPERTYRSDIDPDDLFACGWGTNEDADEELRQILGKQKSFNYPKPVRLLEKLVASVRRSDALCLDFFAGSGTLGHAVMKLNQLDGGNRRFILCTSNENNICREVTWERLQKVIENEGYEASLRYLRVDYQVADIDEN